MGKYILKRLIYVVVVFFIVSFLMYALYNLIPTDPARAQLEPMKNSLKPNEYEQMYSDLRREMGLDDSLVIRYMRWMGLYPASGELLIQRTDDMGNPIQGARYEVLITETGIGGKKTERVLRVLTTNAEGDAVMQMRFGTYKVKEISIPEPHTLDPEPKLLKTDSIFNGMMQGYFGKSQYFKKDVVKVIKEPIKNTMFINIFATIAALGITIPLGIYCAVNKGGKFDSAVQATTILGYSLPIFIISLIFL